MGDVRKREEATRRFQAQNWKGFVALLESLEFPDQPDQMDSSDERRLELVKAARRLPAHHAAAATIGRGGDN